MRAAGGTAAREAGIPDGHLGAQGEGGLSAFELVVLALGFGLCHAWVVAFMGFAGRYDLGMGGLLGYDQVYLFSGAAAAVAVACLSSRVLGEGAACSGAVAEGSGGLRAGNGRGPQAGQTCGSRRCASFAAVNLIGAIAALALLGASVATDANALLVAAFAVCGVASALLQVAWGVRFSLFGMRTALLSVPLGAIVTAVIMMALPGDVLLPSLYALPLLSLLLLYAHRAGDSIVLSLNLGSGEVAYCGTAPALAPAAGMDGRAPQPGERVPVSALSPVSGGTFVRLMASIAVFSLVGRCLDSFPAASVDVGAPAFVADNYAFLAIFVVGALLVVFALVFGERFDVMLVYRLSLPCMVAGFAVLTLFTDSFSIVSVTIVSMGYELFDLLFWALLVGLVRQGASPRPLFVFGWGVALTYAGMGAGTLLSRAVVPPILVGRLDMSALALMCILVLVVLVVLVLPEGVLSRVGISGARAREGDPAAALVEPAPVDTLEACCAAVAARCDLTPRECDVLRLLARGRTLAVVARELNIAEGTARTHMMHIYSKLGVHKQQELIDMVEGEGQN